jgi:hypothetical protein
MSRNLDGLAGTPSGQDGLDEQAQPPPERDDVKKIRAAAVIAIATTAYTKAKDYAHTNPEQASATIDKVEDFVRGRTPAKHADKVGQGGAVVRRGLGLPGRATPTAPSADAERAGALTVAVEDPDPDTSEPWAPHDPSDPSPLAPNPAPGTDDDPQPRRHGDDQAPMTPGEHIAP